MKESKYAYDFLPLMDFFLSNVFLSRLFVLAGIRLSPSKIADEAFDEDVPGLEVETLPGSERGGSL